MKLRISTGRGNFPSSLDHGLSINILYRVSQVTNEAGKLAIGNKSIIRANAKHI
jgi:hypothetical protein